MSNTGFIYKLVSTDVGIKECYVGSSSNIRVRKSSHKRDCNNKNRIQYYYYVYQFIRANGGFETWDMVIIEKYKYNTKHELHSRERYWIEQLQAKLNKTIPTRTRKEYETDNKEKISQRKKEYTSNNKEKISQYLKEYRELNKETISQKNKKYETNNKEKISQRKKEYRSNNKEKISEKRKIAYNKNKEVVNERNKTKFTCDCGSTLRKSDLSQHKKTKKHLIWEKEYNYIYS